jgi:hypothetical protein
MHSITAMLSGPCCANSRLVRPVVFQLPKPRLGPKPGSCPRLRFHGVCWLPRLPRLQHAYAWLSTRTDGRPVHLNRAAIVVPHRPSKIGLLHPPKTSQGSLAGIKREASTLVPGIQQPLWKEWLLLCPRLPLLFKSADALLKPSVHLFPHRGCPARLVIPVSAGAFHAPRFR